MHSRALLCSVLLVACGSTGDTDDSVDGPGDGGAAVDAATIDGSSPGDGGSADGGLRTDAGTMDAETGSDASVPCEPFETVADPTADPPYGGTAFITDELITEDDPTAFVDLSYEGTGRRTMFDRREAAFVEREAHLFDALFGTDTHVEIQVNPEFSQADAETAARTYATVVGRVPAFLFRDLDTFWIHRGMEAFGGGNRNLLIHTAMGDSYASGGELEEIIVHELAHTSMDAHHRDEPRWLEAKAADGVALSTYARDNPDREDIAESLGPYLALRFRSDRIPSETLTTIAETIPNRIRYFDCEGLSMALVP